MSTKIRVGESIIPNSSSSNLSVGEIAVMFETTRGNPNKVYRVSDTSTLDRVFGADASGKKAFKYARYLIGRGHTVQAVRVGNGGNCATAELLTNLTVTAVGEGAGYNGLKVTLKVVDSANKIFSLKVVDANGTILEQYNILSLDEESEYYYDRFIDNDVISLSVSGEVTLADAIDVALAGGTDGSTDGWATAAALLSEQDCKFTLLLIPDYFGAASVAKALPVLIAKTCVEFIPEAIDPNSASYNKSAFDTALASIKTGLVSQNVDYGTYAAAYFPFVKTQNLPGNIPASIVAADVIATLHEKSLIFKAPAGIEDASLKQVINVGLSLTSSEVAAIQDEGANPILNKIGYGPVIWGESTLTSSPVDIEELHIRLLVNYFKRRALEVSERFMFSLHEESTWNLWKSTFEPFIRSVANAGGIENYSVVMDRSIMTEEDIENGILRGQITFKPVHCIKEIYINFNVDNTGISFE